jgi:hypothetical protein
MKHDYDILALLSLNTVFEPIKILLQAAEPLAGPALTLVQIAIGVATFVWIVVRIKGAKLANKKAEKELQDK